MKSQQKLSNIIKEEQPGTNKKYQNLSVVHCKEENMRNTVKSIGEKKTLLVSDNPIDIEGIRTMTHAIKKASDAKVVSDVLQLYDFQKVIFTQKGVTETDFLKAIRNLLLQNHQTEFVLLVKEE